LLVEFRVILYREKKINRVRVSAKVKPRGNGKNFALYFDAFLQPFFFFAFFCGNCRKVLIDFLKEVKKPMDNRLITQRQKIINALREAGNEGITNAELSKISLRYGAHLGDLYRKGYKIAKYNLDGGLYKYVLIAEPADYKYFKNAQQEIIEAMTEKHNEIIAQDLESLLDEKHFHIIRKNGWYQQLY
jgi:hypothetical protein